MNAAGGDAAGLLKIIGELLTGKVIFEVLRHLVHHVAHDAFVERANLVVHRAVGNFDMPFDGFVDFEQADLVGVFFECESAVWATVGKQEVVFYQPLQYLSHVMFG